MAVGYEERGRGIFAALEERNGPLRDYVQGKVAGLNGGQLIAYMENCEESQGTLKSSSNSSADIAKTSARLILAALW